MKHLFHLISLAFILYELQWLISPFEKSKSSKKLADLAKEYQGKGWDDYSPELKNCIYSKSPILLLFAWLFIGLFSFNWIVFAGLILFNACINYPIQKLTNFNVLYAVWQWFSSLIGLAAGLFIVINSYHLKIDLYPIVLQLFKSFQ